MNLLSRIRWLLAFDCLLLAGLAVPIKGGAPEPVRGVDAKWRRYASPHFELFSHNTAARSRDLLHDLELLRAVFLDVLQVKEVRPMEVTIYFFNDGRDFAAYAKNAPAGGNVAGFFLPLPDRSVIVVAPEQDSVVARRVIFHEYIHHLTTAVGEDPPVWYSEGIAELFSTLAEDKNELILGRPVPEHVGYLRSEGMMALDTLFSVGHDDPIYNESAKAGMLYAQSWALLHY